MNEQQFWDLIQPTVHAERIETQMELLYNALNEQSTGDLVDFHNIFLEQMDRAYTWDLWAAAYTIHGGCSDDGFMDFRAWLITRGKDIFEKALVQPDSLVSFAKEKLLESLDGEEFNYLAAEVYEERTEKDIEDDERNRDIDFREDPAGMEWEEDDLNALKDRNPQLFELFRAEWEA